MKRYFSIIFVAFLLAFVACNSNNEELDRDYTGNNKVVISAKSLGAITRSADTDPESTVAWLDVYVMDADKKIIYSERIDKSSAPVVGAGEFVLGKNRDEFTQDESYYVYMIANSTAPLATTSDVKAETWDDLKELTQTDRNLHLSGWGVDNNDVKSPEYFLMDGFAYVPANVNDVGPAAMEAFVINDGGDDNIELAGTLYRAAAKIVLNITQGDNVKFETVLDGATPLYSFYQLPISTLVVAPEAGTRFVSEKQTTGEWGIDNKLFNFIQKDGKPMLTLLGYAYANDWNKEAANESSLLLSIPMMWDKDGDKSTGVDGKEASSPVNWYKVPLSKNNKFERNTCYVINININAIGAEEKNTPIELKDIEYVTLPWQEVQVEIGQTIAKYLTLNTDVVKIYDKNFDLDQLTFTSSSPIKSIKLKDTFSHNLTNSSLAALPLENEITDDEEVDSYEARYTGGDGLYAYYIDKFGQKIQLGTDPGFDLKDVDHTDWTKEVILEKENNLYNKDGVAYNEQYIRAEVPAGQERALNGDIHIYSPIYADSSNPDLDWNSHFEATRYLEFEVMNEQGITATFRVEQIPSVLITHEEGFFSYRSDMKYSDDQEVASHYLNYLGGKSFHLTAFYWFHEHDWSKEFEMTEDWWNQNRNDRDYSWVNPNTCPANQEASGVETIHYSYLANAITYTNSSGKVINTLYAGSHRPTVHPKDPFVRWRYRGIAQAKMDTDGAAIGGLYQKEDGKWYRKHYVWNAQPIFYSMYVANVYDADDPSKNIVKGQANIYAMYHNTPAQNMFVDSPGTGWAPWRHWDRINNHRMYNIRTTTPQTDYTIGFPKLDNVGDTQNIPDNAIMISPNLQIASQLGETFYQSVVDEIVKNDYGFLIPKVGEIYKLAEEHCRNYVETTYVNDDNKIKWWSDGQKTDNSKVIHYDDWRLPTKKEIDQMIQFQQSSRAMDKVLTGKYYFCITGKGNDADINVKENWVSNPVPDYVVGNEGYYIRCVRDVNRKIK